MSETNMPATEVGSASEKEFISYEFAYHVLPTVAEGEVQKVVEKIKAIITKVGGEIFDEEAPQRFDLAYDIIKYLEGKNRKFSSAYFGWVRFRLDSLSIEKVTESLDSNKDLLRYLLVRLTKVEEQNPFKFHESIADRKVRNVEEETEEVEDEKVEEETEVASEDDAKEEVGADEEETV